MNSFAELSKRLRKYRLNINDFFNSFSFSQDSYLLILGGITGILCGYGAVIFHELIHFINRLFFETPAKFFGWSSFIGNYNWISIAFLILIPAIGGLLVGIISKYFEKGDKIEGIPSVILSVASKGGIIKRRMAILKTIDSAVSIGTGGAGGKEGPIVQIGAGIGSAFGQYLSLSADRLKILVGCGTAAGLSAAFNAPIGGALFSMEIILRTFNARSFSPIIIASVFGTVISRSYLGNEPAFSIPKYELVNNAEFLFYIILGILSALISIYFIKSFLKIDELFDRIKKIPIYLKPAVGGLMVGIIGVYLPGIYGYSYQSIDSSLYNQAPLMILILLMVFKPIATGLTIGSGGNGGTFAPSLFTGAMLGGAFGHMVNYLFPELSSPPGAYALVGMGAVVAGTIHAPLTALIMVFEMTNNYKIILPLMLTIIISSIISRSILKGSLYTLKFDKEGKGIDIYGRRISLLQKLPIANLIDPYHDYVDIKDSFKNIVKSLKNSQYNSILVRADYKQVVGQITFQDIRNTILDEEAKQILPLLVAKDLMIENFPKIYFDSNAEEGLKILESNDVEFLPVFQSLNSNNFLGIITKEKILKNYQNELLLQEGASDLSIK